MKRFTLSLLLFFLTVSVAQCQYSRSEDSTFKDSLTVGASAGFLHSSIGISALFRAGFHYNNHSVRLQYRIRKAEPSQAYQVSLDNEKWLQLAVQYSYTFTVEKLRITAAAGPALLQRTYLGEFVSSREWSEKAGRFWFLGWVQLYNHYREDTYRVEETRGYGAAADLTLGIPLTSWLALEGGVHAMYASNGRDVGYSLSMAVGVF